MVLRVVVAVVLLIGMVAGCGPAPRGYGDFRAASEAYLAMDRARVAAIGQAHLAGEEARAAGLAGEAVPEYERARDRLAAMAPQPCYAEAHAATIAAVDATLASVRAWAAGKLPEDEEADGFYLRYALKPQWKHTLDSAAVSCGR